MVRMTARADSPWLHGIILSVPEYARRRHLRWSPGRHGLHDSSFLNVRSIQNLLASELYG